MAEESHMSDEQHDGQEHKDAAASRGIDASYADRYVEPDIYADIDIDAVAPSRPAPRCAASPVTGADAGSEGLRRTGGSSATANEQEAPSAAEKHGDDAAEVAAAPAASASVPSDEIVEEDTAVPVAPEPPAEVIREENTSPTRSARNKRRQRMLLAGIVLLVVAALLALLIPQFFRAPEPSGWTNHTQQPSVAPEGAAPGEQPGDAQPQATESAQPPAEAAPPALDQTSPDSLTVLVNKLHPLEPSTHEPGDLVDLATLGVSASNGQPLRSEAANALAEMFAAARGAGLELDLTSGYRPFSMQQELYHGFVGSLGQEAADLTSARPGHSEHQTGLAADISQVGGDCTLAACFGETPAGAWLAEHSWEYGFILRYPAGQTEVTGFEYEPWHFRYIGREQAAAYHQSGAATFEQFLGSTPAPGYAS